MKSDDGRDTRIFGERLREAEARLRKETRRLAMGDADFADDLFQLVTIRLWSKRKTFRNEGHWRSWALRVTRNVCLKVLKQRFPIRTESLLDSVPDQSEGMSASDLVAEQRLREERLEGVADEVVRLPPRLRAIVIAAYWFDKAPRVIANELGLRPQSVWTGLSQALNRLRTSLTRSSRRYG